MSNASFPINAKTENTIILHEKHRTMKDNRKILHTLNKHFINLIKTLKLKKTSRALKSKP